MKCGGDGVGRALAVPPGAGNSAGFEDARDAVPRSSFIDVTTLAVGNDPTPKGDVGQQPAAVPLGIETDRIACRLRKYGADATLKFSLFAVDANAGVRVSLSARENGKNLGVTSFVRLKVYEDLFWIEGGALAYSNQQNAEAGHGYIMAYIDPDSIITSLSRRFLD